MKIKYRGETLVDRPEREILIGCLDLSIFFHGAARPVPEKYVRREINTSSPSYECLVPPSYIWINASFAPNFMGTNLFITFDSLQKRPYYQVLWESDDYLVDELLSKLDGTSSSLPVGIYIYLS